MRGGGRNRGGAPVSFFSHRGLPMSVEFFLRLVGMVALAVGGIYLGVYLGRLAEGPVELWASIFALVGALTGLIITPFLSTRPIRAFRTLMSQVSAQTVVAGF